jgi:dTDP-4-dehydrorhamnose reductase
MLGQAVMRAAGAGAVGLTHSELDVTDAAAVREALASAEVVVNCAAYTDVDGAEADPETASRVNGDGAGHVAAAAAGAGALVVHVSTDYVFDGAAREPYLESDQPRPISAYGRSKLAGERAVQDAATAHAIVRTSWLFGSGGRNFVDTMLRAAQERDEVGVVSDQLGCPTWTGHLAAGLVEIAERRLLGLLHVAASGQCSWHELAVEAFRQAGVECAVAERRTADLGRPAPRPAYSVLRSRRPDTPVLPPWQEGLAGYLAERAAAGAGAPSPSRAA